MKISGKDVLYVADLARLHIEKDSIDKFALQINQILEYVEKLNEVDTQNIPPTSHAIFLKNAFRKDFEKEENIDMEEMLYNAPEKENNCFVVPKIIG